MIERTMKSYLEDNPRKIGILFGIMLMLTQVQPALGGLYAVHGP